MKRLYATYGAFLDPTDSTIGAQPSSVPAQSSGGGGGFGGFSSFIPMILQGAGASWQLGAQHVGRKEVVDKYVLPYTYGAPNADIGRYGGLYSGAGYKKAFQGRKAFTKLGRTMNAIGVGHEVAAGDTSQIGTLFNSDAETRSNLYNQWAGAQSSFVLGKKGIYIEPSKKGSFTAWCKKNGYGGVTSACKSAGRNSKSSAIRKKANFATNAAKWNH